MLRLTIAFSLFMFLLFRPFQLEKPGLVYPGDDFSYFAFTTAIVFGEYPNLTKEYVDEGKVPLLSRVGPALISLPFTFLGSLIDRLDRHPIVNARTKENIRTSWTFFGALFSSVVFAWLTLLILYRALILISSRDAAFWTVSMVVFSSGLLLYAFRRPVFTHVYECFLHSSLLYLFLRFQTRSPWYKRLQLLRTSFVVVALCSLLLLIRENSAPFIVIWPALILGLDRWKWCFNIRSVGIVFAVIMSSFLTYAFVKNIPRITYPALFSTPYTGTAQVNFLWDWYGLWFYVKRTFSLLFGADWGLAYTAPHMLLGLGGLILYARSQMKWLLLLLFPVAVQFYICVVWRGQGGWYGYRYLVFCTTPLACVGFALLWHNALANKAVLRVLIGSLMIPPLASMFLFDATPITLLHGVVTEFGEKNAGNLTYQINVWKNILFDPLYTLQAIAKGGPAFLIYAFASAVGLSAYLPQKLAELYFNFSSQFFVQTLVLYIVPWLLYLAFCKGKRSQER